MTPALMRSPISTKGVSPTYTSQVLSPFFASATKRAMSNPCVGAICEFTSPNDLLKAGMEGCRSMIQS